MIDNIEDGVRDKLADLARCRGRRVAEEARDILRGAVIWREEADANLRSRLADRFAGFGLDEEIFEWRQIPLSLLF
jgi:plasmid stability protein